MKKIDLYEDALERIRDFTPHAFDDGAFKAIQLIATNALIEGEKESDPERTALIQSVAEHMLAKGLIYSTTEEIAASLNEASILSRRGKAWSRASVARLLPQFRAAVLNRLGVVTAAPVVMEQEVETVTVDAAPVQIAAEPAASPEPMSVVTKPAPIPMPDMPKEVVEPLDLGDLDELEELIRSH